MNELNILVGQIQRKQKYESMGMIQPLKTIAEQKDREIEQAIRIAAEKKAKDKINKAYEKEKRKYVIFTIN